MLRIVCRIVGNQHNAPVRFFFYALDRGTVSIDHNHGRIASVGVVLLADDYYIAFPDTGLHRAALDPQAEEVAGGCQGCVDLFIVYNVLYSLNGDAGGNVTQDGNSNSFAMRSRSISEQIIC